MCIRRLVSWLRRDDNLSKNEITILRVMNTRARMFSVYEIMVHANGLLSPDRAWVTLDGLERKGLVEWVDPYKYRLTDAGRDAAKTVCIA